MAPNIAISWPFSCIPMLGYLFWNKENVNVSAQQGTSCAPMLSVTSWGSRSQISITPGKSSLHSLQRTRCVQPGWCWLKPHPAPTATTSVKSWAFWVWRCCANSSVDEAAAAAPCWALLVQQLATVGTEPGKYPDSRSFLHPQSWTRELPFESRTVPQFLEHRF